MSDTEKDVEAAVAPDAEFEQPASEIVVTKKSGASVTVAWLALFLAFLTTAGVGYLYLERYRADSNAEDQEKVASQLSQQLASANDSLGALQSKIDDLTAAEQRTNALIDALRSDLDNRTEQLESLPSRTNNLERSLAALQGVSIDARNTYLIAEAEYYLQIANSQLQLAGNPYLASLALEQADDRLLQLADPALTEVRRAIANEIAALEVMEKPDISGVALTLASLARVVDALPLRNAAGEESAANTDPGEAPGGMARAWSAVKGAFTGLVKHTPPQDREAPLLRPDAEPMIRSNLALQLQAARLALLRGEQQVFEQSIDDAGAWIRAYFDTAGAPVQSALETLTEIRDGYSTSVAPDISGSLKLLRQYETLSEPVE